MKVCTFVSCSDKTFRSMITWSTPILYLGFVSLCRSHQNSTSKGVLAISKQSNSLIVLKKKKKCSSWKTKYARNIAVAKSFLERLFENSLWSPKHSVENRLAGANHLLGIGMGFRTSYNPVRSFKFIHANNVKQV